MICVYLYLNVRSTAGVGGEKGGDSVSGTKRQRTTVAGFGEAHAITVRVFEDVEPVEPAVSSTMQLR